VLINKSIIKKEINMTNLVIILQVQKPDNSTPDATWLPCGDNGAGYYYKFSSSPDDGWNATDTAFVFPDGTNDSIRIMLDNSTATMFHISALIVYQQPGQGQGRNRTKQTMVASPDISITSYVGAPAFLDLTDTNSNPGNNPRTGYFKVLVHHVKDSTGAALPNPVGFIACDPYWEDD
jgi:hypothetical protein